MCFIKNYASLYVIVGGNVEMAYDKCCYIFTNSGQSEEIRGNVMLK